MTCSSYFVVFTAILIVQFVSSTPSQDRSVSGLQFKFKGLIGLPSFFKAHIMVGFDDLSTSESYLLDFLPIDAANPEVMKNLIQGKSMPGEVRINRVSYYAGTKRQDEILDFEKGRDRGDAIVQGQRYANLLIEDFNPTINLYGNNCYNFALHCIAKDKEIREI